MHDEQNYWNQLWNENDLAFNQMAVNPLLTEFFPTVGSTPQTVFVPLCGKSIDMIWLLAQGHHVVGCELNPIACQHFFEENKLEYTVEPLGDFTCYKNERVTLYCGDLFNLTADLLQNVSIVYDRAAIIALSASTRKRYADTLLNLLPNPITILMIVLTYDQPRDRPPNNVAVKEATTLFAPRFITKVLCDRVADRLLDRGFINPMNHVLLLNEND